MRLKPLSFLFRRSHSLLYPSGLLIPSRIVWFRFFLDSVERGNILSNLFNLVLRLLVLHLLRTRPLRWSNIVEEKLLIFHLIVWVVVRGSKKHINIILLGFFNVWSRRDFFYFRGRPSIFMMSSLVYRRNFAIIALLSHFHIFLNYFLALDRNTFFLLFNLTIFFLHHVFIMFTLSLTVFNRLLWGCICCGLGVEILTMITFFWLSFEYFICLALFLS